MRKPGFTLIEVLIVIVLMGILAVMATNSFVGMNRSAKLNEAYTQITNMIQQARSFAVNGKQVIDYTDINQNGTDTDIVVANSYGVYFSKTEKKILAFAVYHNQPYTSLANFYEHDPTLGVEPDPAAHSAIDNKIDTEGKELILASYVLPNGFVLNDAADGIALLYSPPLGKFSIAPAKDIATIQICYTACDAGNPQKQIKIYKNSSGLPEKQ